MSHGAELRRYSYIGASASAMTLRLCRDRGMLRLSRRRSRRRLDRACAKIGAVLQHADRREARTQKRLGQAAFRLSQMASKAELQRAARLEYGGDFAQPADRIRPC